MSWLTSTLQPSFLSALRALDKRRVAALLKRAPWTGYAAQWLWRRWQPWVTVGVIGAVFNGEGRLLVVEHVFHPILPWGLPGGWMTRNENPEDTVRREVVEETGLQVEVVKPLLLENAPSLPRHLDVAYLCYVTAGEIRLSGELLAYQWVDPLQAPPMPDFHARTAKAGLAEHKLLSAIR